MVHHVVGVLGLGGLLDHSVELALCGCAYRRLYPSGHDPSAVANRSSSHASTVLARQATAWGPSRAAGGKCPDRHRCSTLQDKVLDIKKFLL